MGLLSQLHTFYTPLSRPVSFTDTLTPSHHIKGRGKFSEAVSTRRGPFYLPQYINLLIRDHGEDMYFSENVCGFKCM